MTALNADTVGRTFANSLEIMKPWFDEGVMSQFASDDTLLSLIERQKENVVGGHIIGAINTGRSHGHGGSHTTLLPDPDRQKYQNARATLTKFYGSGQIDGEVMQKAREDPGAFIEPIAAELSGIVRDQRDDWSDMCAGDGSGRVGTVIGVGSAGSGILTVKHPFDLPASTAAKEGGVAPRVQVGGYYAIVDISASATGAQSFHVTDAGTSGVKRFYCSAVDEDTGACTFLMPDQTNAISFTAGTGTNNLAAAVVAGDVLVRVKDRTNTNATDAADATFHTKHTSYRKLGSQFVSNASDGCAELMGFYAPASDADVFAEYQSGTAAGLGYQGLTVAANPYWKGYVDSNSGTPRALTVRMFTKAIDKIEIGGDGNVPFYITSPAVREIIRSTFTEDDVRYVNTDDAKIGFRGLHVMGRPMIITDAMPASGILMFDPSIFSLEMLEAFGFLARDGMIFRQVPQHDEWSFHTVMQAQTWCRMRRRFSRIDDIDVTP